MALDTKPKILFTDGEGPLVFKDLARDVSTRIPKGILLFDTLSMYNGFISETHSGPNEPGDTLSLLVPHLLTHDLGDNDLKEEVQTVTLATGVEEYLQSLYQKDWRIIVISTAYSALWDYVGPKLGIPNTDIVSTALNLESLKNCWPDEASKVTYQLEHFVRSNSTQIEEAQQFYREGYAVEDLFTKNETMVKVKEAMDKLYREDLPGLGFNPLESTHVVNGKRKAEIIASVAETAKLRPEEIVYIGDSITDDRANRFVRENGGLAIAVNGDRFALRNANVGVATEDMQALLPIIEGFSRGGFEAVKVLVGSGAETSFSAGKERFMSAREFSTPRYHLLESQADFKGIAAVHRQYAKEIRGSSAPLI